MISQAGSNPFLKQPVQAAVVMQSASGVTIAPVELREKSTARPQTEDAARSGLKMTDTFGSVAPSTSGELFLKTISRHGDNRERQVAAATNRAAASAISPETTLATRQLALNGLANGVHGPIGAILGKFGEAVLSSVPGLDARTVAGHTMGEVAKHSKNAGEAAIAELVGHFNPLSDEGALLHQSAFGLFASGRTPESADKAIASFALGTAPLTSDPLTHAVLNHAALLAIGEHSGSDKVQGDVVGAATNLALKKDTAEALAVQTEALYFVATR